MPAFSLRSRSPDGAAADCGDNIQLQLTTHLSTPKGHLCREGVGHFPLPQPPSAGLQYKAMYR